MLIFYQNNIDKSSIGRENSKKTGRMCLNFPEILKLPEKCARLYAKAFLYEV